MHPTIQLLKVTYGGDLIVNKFPCIECIIYAMCKYKEIIKCEKLYSYVESRNSFPKEMPSLIQLKHEGKYPFGNYLNLNKGTTRWFPDS